MGPVVSFHRRQFAQVDGGHGRKGQGLLGFIDPINGDLAKRSPGQRCFILAGLFKGADPGAAIRRGNNFKLAGANNVVPALEQLQAYWFGRIELDFKLLIHTAERRNHHSLAPHHGVEPALQQRRPFGHEQEIRLGGGVPHVEHVALATRGGDQDPGLDVCCKRRELVPRRKRKGLAAGQELQVGHFKAKPRGVFEIRKQPGTGLARG